MTSIIRSLFKSRKAQKEYETDEQYVVFQPCVRSSSWKRKPTTRFADDCMLPPTAAYHTTSAPKLRKGPQSCPGSNRDDIIDGIPESFRKKPEKRRKYRPDDANHKKFSIDSKFEQGFRQHGSRNDLKTRDGESLSIKLGRSRNSLFDSRSENEECENDIEVGVDDRIAILQQKSLFYMQQWENSERQRIDEQRKQERLELERCSIQNAMGNIAYCMASVQQIEQLKRERDQYKKEMSRYKNKCEKLESRYEKLENLSPNYAAFQSFRNPLQPSAFQAPQFPPEQMSFNLPNQNSLLLSEVPVPLPNVHRPVNCLTNGPQPSHYSISLDFLNNEQLSSRHGGSVNLPMTDTPITFGSEGAGESLVNPTDVSYNRNSSIGKAPISYYNEDDEDEIKIYRREK